MKGTIAISPNMAIYADNLAVLGHEIIHSYHFFTGMMSLFGRDWSEYHAYAYSASIPYSMQQQANRMMATYSLAPTINTFFSKNLGHHVYPSWVSRTFPY